MASEKEKVLTNLRACIISSQGGVRATEINNDYRCLVGESVPFKRLGFPTLESFLGELPNVNVVQKNGEWWVEAKLDKASSHIQKLVQGQQKSKSSKKPRRRAHFNTRFNSSAPRYFHKPNNSQVPHFMQTSKPALLPTPKPKARYIPPVRNTVASIQNNDWAQKSMPTVVFEPKKAAVSQPCSEQTPAPLPERTIRPLAEEQRSWPVAVRMRTTAGNSLRRPALLPTPVQATGPVMPTPYEYVDRTPLPVPPISHNAQLPKKPVANQPIPSLLDNLQAPPTKPLHQSKPNKPSIADRLLVHKANKKTEHSLQESLQGMHLQTPANNGTSATPDVTFPPTAGVPYKIVFPTLGSKYKKPTNGDASSTSRRREGKNFLPQYAYDDSSYSIKLTRYAEEHNWPIPEFFVLTRRVKHGPKSELFYLGRVCITCTPIGSKKSENDNSSTYEFSSYPEEFSDVNLAMNSVAKKAYDSLVGTTAIKLPETKQHDVMFDRLNQMMSGKTQGVWLFQIEREYKDKFNEVLPSNLPELLKQECPNLEVSKLTEAAYIIHSKTELLPNSPSNLCDKAIIGQVSLPEDDHWDVFVTKMKSFNEIYVRLIGETSSVLFETMCNVMDDCYMNNPTLPPPEFVKIGTYYAFMCESDSSAYRCLVTGTVGNKYQIYLIDLGDVEFVEVNSLRQLHPEFYEVPSQALLCFLDHLDNFDFALNDNYAELSNKVQDLIVGKSFATFVQSREPIRTILFDTDSDVDENMNHRIKDLVLNSFADPRVAFQEKGFLREIHVSCIDSQGQVFAQKPSWTLDCLNDKFSMICNGVFEVIHVNEQNLSFNKLYCMSSIPTRVKVLNVLDNGRLLVDCVDTGGIMDTDMVDLLDVPQLDDILPFIPRQAIRVLMHDIGDGTLSPEQARRCLEAINSTDQPAIGKVISHVNGMPVVELFIRNEKNRFLMSLNQNINLMNDEEAAPMIDDDAASVSGACSVASFATETSFSSRPGTICSQLSVDNRLTSSSKYENILNKGPLNFKINDELDIYVTRIATPHNFTVDISCAEDPCTRSVTLALAGGVEWQQGPPDHDLIYSDNVIPVKYLKYLNALIDNMTVHYSTFSPMDSYVPQLKECVAGFSGNCWFRVQIDKQLDSDCYSGRFLDQGHMEMFATKSLRVLHDKFKRLPYLASKGQLHGVKPINGKDWEVDDCIRLKKMIQGKKLVSTVRDIITDGDEKKLSLEIIDTSTEEDIYISRQMVLEGRALNDYAE